MSPNIETMERVAARLGPLKDAVVFVGGAVTELLVTDPGAPEPRMTADIDAIVEVSTAAEYYAFAERLRTAGFTEDRSEGAPVCRWVLDGTRVDLMPPDEGILGFSNRWYAGAIRHAEVRRLPGGADVRVVTAPFFLATKLEAFAGRGRGDFTASHDIEDLVALVDGRAELAEEVRAAPPDVREDLSARAFRPSTARSRSFGDCTFRRVTSRDEPRRSAPRPPRRDSPRRTATTRENHFA